MSEERDDGRWANWRSTCALTGIEPCDLAWAMAREQVDYTVDLPGHQGVPMIFLDDVTALLATNRQHPRQRMMR